MRTVPSNAPAWNASGYEAVRGMTTGVLPLALAREKGLILLRSGPHHNVIRTLMPLTIPDEQLDEGLDILGSSLAEVTAAVPL